MHLFPFLLDISAIGFTGTELFEVISGKNHALQLILVSINSAALIVISLNVTKAENFVERRSSEKKRLGIIN